MAKPVLRWLGAAAALAAVALLSGAVTRAAGGPDFKAPVHFRSFVVNTWSGRSGVLDVTIKNWSTAEQSRALQSAVNDGGMPAAVKVLEKMPELGTIQVPGYLGLPLHFTAAMAGPENTTEVIAITDRWLRTWEVMNQTITTDYPLTVVELKMKTDGEGTGEVYPMARIGYWDAKTNLVSVDNFTVQPLLLPTVRVERGN